MKNDNVTSVSEEEIVPPDKAKSGKSLGSLFARVFSGLGAGVVAGLVSVFCMLVLRLVAGIPTPVELFGDFILKKMPAGKFVDLLILFSPNSKTAPLGLTTLAMVALGAMIGFLYAGAVRLKVPVMGYRPGRREWLTMGVLGLAMALVGTVLFWTEIRQNFLGLPVDLSRLVSILGLLLDFALYALVLGWCYRALLPKRESSGGQIVAQNRRAMLARAGVSVLGVGALGGTLGLVREYLNNYASYDGLQTGRNGIVSPITTNDEHYVVTQNPIDPTPSLDVWRLEITGLVGESGTYTYEQFTSLPSVSRAITLECIANGVGSHLVSTAIWQGVEVRSLLAKHGGAQTGARYVAFYSVDGYTVCQPLDEVLKVDTLLAFRMNGAQLPERHGFPLRVLIAGHYGEENPKWVTRMELTDHFVDGLYSSQGWYNGPIPTISRIDRPQGSIHIQPTIEVTGMAFSGYRGIQKVEISTDNGVSWQESRLSPPLSSQSWVFWTYDWHPTSTGHYTLVARATDGTGQLQIMQQRGTVPEGATGYHHLPVTLVS